MLINNRPCYTCLRDVLKIDTTILNFYEIKSKDIGNIEISH